MRLVQLGGLFILAWSIPYAIRRLDDRLTARAQVSLYVAALAAILGTTVALLLVAMAPEVLAAENLVEVFRACFGALRTILSHPAAHVPALLAAGVLALVVVRSALAALRLTAAALRVRREAERLRDPSGDSMIEPRWRDDIIVTSQDEAVAYVAGIVSPVIVVSAGLLLSLDAGERIATLAHEEAHRRGRHPWLLIVAGAVARGLSPLPPVRHAFTGLRRALEARADDASARFVDVTTLARAIGKAALGPAAASAPGMGESDIVWRVRRLLDPPRPRRLAAAALLVATLAIFLSAQMITVTSASSLLAAAEQAGHHCRIPGWAPPSI